MFNWVRNFFAARSLEAERSGEWPRVRKEHLVKEPVCQACGSKEKLEVHHVVPFNVDKSKELCPDNLITLCEAHCHLMFGHLLNFKSYNEHVREDAKAWRTKIENRP